MAGTPEQRKPVALASIIVHAKKAQPDMTDEEHRQRREAADRLWQDIKRAVAERR